MFHQTKKNTRAGQPKCYVLMMISVVCGSYVGYNYM